MTKQEYLQWLQKMVNNEDEWAEKGWMEEGPRMAHKMASWAFREALIKGIDLDG